MAVLAPAKLNLFLEVIGRREDGFHEIETLMVAVTIFDTIYFTSTNEDRLRLKCVATAGNRARELARKAAPGLLGDVPGDQRNLVVQAVEQLRRASRVRSGASIELIKRIPAAAGLGGASSDAAAAMMAANVAWNLGWTKAQLAGLAAELGSDIPFFFGPGAAVCRGRGERVDPLCLPVQLHVVVVRPPEGLNTADVYRHCSPATQRVAVTPLLTALGRGDTGAAARCLLNRLQPAAARLTPWIDRLCCVFDRLDCLGHQMSGSGTSYFGICRHAGHARRVAARLRGEELGFVSVATSISTPRQPPDTASES